MAITSYIILIIIALAFTALALFFVLLISKNVREGKVMREQLEIRVESLRMSKMLRALGLDFSKYLYRVPLTKINHSMNNCETCDVTDQCDEKLKQPEIKPEEIDFCPNHECLGKFNEIKPEKA